MKNALNLWSRVPDTIPDLSNYSTGVRKIGLKLECQNLNQGSVLRFFLTSGKLLNTPVSQFLHIYNNNYHNLVVLFVKMRIKMS